MSKQPVILRCLAIALALSLAPEFVTAEEVGLLVEHIELSKTEATRLLLADEDPAALRAAIGEAIKADRAKVIDLAYLLGRTGANYASRSQSIVEYLYPTEWDPGQVVNDIRVDVTADMDLRLPANPTAFDVRNLGITLEIRALRRPGGARLQLAVSDELTRLTRLRPYGAEWLGIVQPEFETQPVKAITSCTHRRPILLGVYTPRPTALRHRRVFVFGTPFIKNYEPPNAPPEPAPPGEISDPFSDGDGRDNSPEVLGGTIGVEFIEVTQKHLAGLLDGVPHLLGKSSDMRKRTQRLIESGEAKLITSGTLKTVPDQRGKIEPVHEFIYPTEYDPPELPERLTPEILARNPKLKTSAIPTAFDVRNVGLTIEAEFSLAENEGLVEMVNLNIAAEVVELAQRISWGKMEAAAVQPIFGLQKIETQFSVKPGDEALAAILTPRKKDDGSADGERRLMVFVWVELAKAVGKSQ